MSTQLFSSDDSEISSRFVTGTIHKNAAKGDSKNVQKFGHIEPNGKSKLVTFEDEINTLKKTLQNQDLDEKSLTSDLQEKNESNTNQNWSRGPKIDTMLAYYDILS